MQNSGNGRRQRDHLLDLKRNGLFALFGFLSPNFFKAIFLMKMPGDLIFGLQVVFACHDGNVALCGKIFKILVQRKGNAFSTQIGCNDNSVDIDKGVIVLFKPLEIKTIVIGLWIKND